MNSFFAAACANTAPDLRKRTRRVTAGLALAAASLGWAGTASAELVSWTYTSGPLLLSEYDYYNYDTGEEYHIDSLPANVTRPADLPAFSLTFTGDTDLMSGAGEGKIMLLADVSYFDWYGWENDAIPINSIGVTAVSGLYLSLTDLSFYYGSGGGAFKIDSKGKVIDWGVQFSSMNEEFSYYFATNDPGSYGFSAYWYYPEFLHVRWASTTGTWTRTGGGSVFGPAPVPAPLPAVSLIAGLGLLWPLARRRRPGSRSSAPSN